MSLFWFDFLRGTVPNHLITADVDRLSRPLLPFRDQLEGRSMLVKRCRMEPIECVARGYVSGSGWKDYKKTGAICGIRLPAGLRRKRQAARTHLHSRHRKPNPATTKTSPSKPPRKSSAARPPRCCAISPCASTPKPPPTPNPAASSSPIPSSSSAGTDGQLLLADEVLTPDSSRFWPRDEYSPGGPQKSFDKQFVRDYLETLDWNKQPPAPPLPADVIEKTPMKYIEAYRRLTGRDL